LGSVHQNTLAREREGRVRVMKQITINLIALTPALSLTGEGA
jgi:hypothetical protein